MTDVVLAGGGLANGLIALRLRAVRPDVSVTLLERDERVGGNHTWSFHESDLSAAQREWLAPVVAHAWRRHSVRFPGYERVLERGYFSITSERLHEAVAAALGSGLRLGADITAVGPDAVELAGGERLAGQLVIDGRGASAAVTACFELRWQKFLGMEVELARPHGLEGPLLMDATVAQRDGYRFVYVLPLAPTRVLIEDTYYSDEAELRQGEVRVRIVEYAAARGWRFAEIVREESGVLPIVLDGDPRAFWQGAEHEAPRAGMRGMLCHHTTGYSLGEAVRVAELVASAPQLASAPLAVAIRDRALRRWREQRFFRLLNRLMFEVAEPAERYRTLAHFYRMPEEIIGRFYAGRVQPLDALRILSGKPPVPVSRALGCLVRGLLPARSAAAHARPESEGRA